MPHPFIFLELAADISDLYEIGLTEEEIDGYICFFVEKYDLAKVFAQDLPH